MHDFNRIVFMESIEMIRHLFGKRFAALLLIAIIVASVFAGRLPAIRAAEIAPEEEEGGDTESQRDECREAHGPGLPWGVVNPSDDARDQKHA